jgi:Ca2+-binding EF-hand superfamily protein
MDNLGQVSEECWLRKVITDPIFEWVCAVVIITNAVTIGITAEDSIQWAVKYPGRPFDNMRPVIVIMNRMYLSFYLIELLLKLWVWRCEFFIGKNARWNLFDFLLVLTGVYDFLTEVTSLGTGMNMTWLRVLRIVKTLKLLRVIRVMRFFQQLRLIVSSITGSMATLGWSILMLAIMMYMFALCFLNSVTAYLNEHTREEIDSQVYDDVVEFWSSVVQSMMTLFWAVTGGNDWAPLAHAIKEADAFFYCLFFFYIAFAAFAVLNVLTGMFVDTAMKVAQQDQENVAEELLNRPQIKEFRHFVEQNPDVTPGFISRSFLEQQMDSLVVQNFYKVLEITEEDFKRVFAMLDSEKTGVIDLDEFIKGCCHANGGVSGLDMVFLNNEIKHVGKQLLMSVDYCEERFNEILKKCADGEKSTVLGWKARLSESSRTSLESKQTPPF